MTHPASPERPIATKCGHCGYTNGGAFSVCPICKVALHANDADYRESDYERRPEPSEYEEHFWDDYQQRVRDLK